MHQGRKEIGLYLQRFGKRAKSRIVPAMGFKLYARIGSQLMDDGMQMSTVAKREMRFFCENGIPEGHGVLRAFHVQKKGHALVEHGIGMIGLYGYGLLVVFQSLGALPLHTVHGPHVGNDVRIAGNQFE